MKTTGRGAEDYWRGDLRGGKNFKGSYVVCRCRWWEWDTGRRGGLGVVVEGQGGWMVKQMVGRRVWTGTRYK